MRTIGLLGGNAYGEIPASTGTWEPFRGSQQQLPSSGAMQTRTTASVAVSSYGVPMIDAAQTETPNRS